DEADLFRRAQDGGQVLDGILGALPVPALQDLPYDTRDWFDALRGLRLDVQRIDSLDLRKVAKHRDRDENGFLADFRLPKAFHSLLERANHGKRQTVDLKRLANRAGLAAIQANSQL